jgi:hypothetical protein
MMRVENKITLITGGASGGKRHRFFGMCEDYGGVIVSGDYGAFTNIILKR